MEKKRVDVLDRTMAHVEAGEGRPIGLLHGNPTSSYLWRAVIPHLAPLGRCLAPDLIGMGDSDKLLDSGPDRYRFVEHRRYLDAWFEAVGATEDVTLVIHDWGSALGFDWAARHPDAVSGIAYMEAIVCPVTWADWPEMARDIFRALRSPGGEEMILERNLFVEAILPASVLRQTTDEEMDEYRRPFARAGEDRRPTLAWPRQIPIEGEPADVVDVVEAYGVAIPKRPRLLHAHRVRQALALRPSTHHIRRGPATGDLPWRSRCRRSSRQTVAPIIRSGSRWRW